MEDGRARGRRGGGGQDTWPRQDQGGSHTKAEHLQGIPRLNLSRALSLGRGPVPRTGQDALLQGVGSWGEDLIG